MGKRIYTDICVRGEVFPDANAVAERFGVTPDAVRIAVRRGTAHRIGTGAVGVEPMPVRVAGRDFPTAQAAARHFGVTSHAVYQAIQEGRADEFRQRYRNPGHRARPFSIGGLSWPSMLAADRALGFKEGYIANVMKRGSKRGHERILAAAMAYATKDAAP